MPATAINQGKPPTVLSSWTQVLVSALEQRGLDTRPLLLAAGIDPASVAEPGRRFPLAATTRLWQLAAEQTREETLGLWVSKFSNHTTFHALGYAFMASRNLREALERVVRFNATVSDVAEVSFARRADTSVIDWHLRPGATQPAPEAMEAVISAILRACRRLLGPDFSPLRVKLMRPEPEQAQAFADFFRCEVEYAHPGYELEFLTGELERPLAGGNDELARSNDRVMEAYLARLEIGSVATRLRTLLATDLPSGVKSQEDYAGILGMSGRSLQRKLSAEGVTFNQVLSETRCDLARSYLGEAGGPSLAEVAFLLGFSDSSSFSRAFHRWTGIAPSAFAAGERPQHQDPGL
ncbi:helix-turn-helix domain-containing protein [Seongchinamella sediminis]|uniref:Helix-turn-helix domain-containing protein n=1 Tax=Seongchinamella sediminis TaxID=2283635 RepID=A0A3L7DW47_9GAMM|nr:AraC family transcriptional regulator [Seongchinamella sediminis]RLQ20171.1 helix-turn-helix domain-containing protein [Seongchinamella sediminis]